MITSRPAARRGYFDFGWLKTFHTFSFGNYYDEANMGFRALRVINEDFVAPGRGFPTHPHRDMEIITYILDGALQHRDSMGTGSTITPGEVQRMSAGTGVTHSERNPSPDQPTHLLQIWIVPGRPGLTPSYEQKNFPTEERRGKLRLIASPDAALGSVQIHQDARIYVALLASSEHVTHLLSPGRHAWIQVARGSVQFNDIKLSAGDGAAVSEEKQLQIVSQGDSEVLLFDLG